MIKWPASYLADQRGAAAGEMALMLPLLMTLLYGGMEAGHFFYREQQVVKAVREGARFAGRQPMDAYDCEAGTVEDDTEEVVEGLLEQSLVGDYTITVGVAPCVAGSSTGLFTEMENGAPIAVVSVWIEYDSLYSNLGFDTVDLTLFATAQSAVMGL